MQSNTQYSYDECAQWMQQDTVNPQTKRNIEVGGDVYRSLYHSCGQLFGVVPASSYYYAEVLLQQIIDMEYKIGYLDLELNNFYKFRDELVRELNKWLKNPVDPTKLITKLPDTAGAFIQPADFLKGRKNIQGFTFDQPIAEIPEQVKHAIKPKKFQDGGVTTGVAELDEYEKGGVLTGIHGYNEMLKGQGITTGEQDKDVFNKGAIAFSDPEGTYWWLSPDSTTPFKFSKYDLENLPYVLKQNSLYKDYYDSVLKEMVDTRYDTVFQFVKVAEAFFFNDKDIAWKIYEAETTDDITYLEEQITDYDKTTWDISEIDFVKFATYFKFHNNDRAKKELIKTGNKILIYATGDGTDGYWNVGTMDINYDFENLSEDRWDGNNEMGIIIMDVRDIIRSQKHKGGSQKRKGGFPQKKKRFSRPRSATRSRKNVKWA